MREPTPDPEPAPAPTAGDALATAFARLAKGDTGALEAVYDAMAGELYALALWRTGSREAAEDAVQEVFVRLAAAGPRLARVREPRAYLLRMAHNAAVSVLRRRRPHETPDALLVADAAAGPEARLLAREVTAALRRLPAPQREAVYLRCWLGLTFREMGRVTGVPTFTAASRFRLAIARLRRMLGVTP